MYNQFDSYEFIHVLNGTRFRQGINKSQVITYTLIEKDNEIVGMTLYVNAIVSDTKTGTSISSKYTLEADEAEKFREWFLWR